MEHENYTPIDCFVLFLAGPEHGMRERLAARLATLPLSVSRRRVGFTCNATLK
jgi:hypothetical protein